ncbi:hypothetical protein [Radiobacillus sp. PE A8.2]|uniref:hypothetical protein n=1 Tax=Radiobacillus sp. PE A8.2 TaxID=3380349 RepID=UPI003890F234
MPGKKTVLITMLVLIIAAFIMLAIFPPNSNLEFNERVTSIEVYNHQADELIDTITDTTFIKELMKELDNSRTGLVSSHDAGSPSYNLVFKSNQKKALELGYYLDAIYADGISGRYVGSDVIYGVTLQLPLE